MFALLESSPTMNGGRASFGDEAVVRSIPLLTASCKLFNEQRREGELACSKPALLNVGIVSDQLNDNVALSSTTREWQAVGHLSDMATPRPSRFIALPLCLIVP